MEARFDIIKEVTMQNTVLSDITSCRLVESYQRFGKTYCILLRGKIVVNPL
jgi:hypothetical protein